MRHCSRIADCMGSITQQQDPTLHQPHLRRLVNHHHVKLAGQASEGGAAAERQRGAHCIQRAGGQGAGAAAQRTARGWTAQGCGFAGRTHLPCWWHALLALCTHPSPQPALQSGDRYTPALPPHPTPPMLASSRIAMRSRSFPHRATFRGPVRHSRSRVANSL